MPNPTWRDVLAWVVIETVMVFLALLVGLVLIQMQ